MSDTELRTATELDGSTGFELADADIMPITKAAGGSGLFRTTLATLKDYFTAGGTSLPIGGTAGQVLTKIDSTDGNADWETPAGSSLYRFGGFFTTTPAASEVIMLHVATDAFSLPDDLVGACVNVGTNPSATAAFDFKLNGASVGTVSISSAGVVTLVTAGGAVAVVATDLLSLVAPADSHGAANVAFTFRGS